MSLDTNARPSSRSVPDFTTNAPSSMQAHYAGAVPLDLLKSEQDRIANQAFFERLHVTDETRIDSEHGEPFNILFDPAVHQTAVSRQGQTAVEAGQTGNVASLNDDVLVEPRGLEPLTPCLQSRCATNCAKAPVAESAPVGLGGGHGVGGLGPEGLLLPAHHNLLVRERGADGRQGNEESLLHSGASLPPADRHVASGKGATGADRGGSHSL